MAAVARPEWTTSSTRSPRCADHSCRRIGRGPALLARPTRTTMRHPRGVGGHVAPLRSTRPEPLSESRAAGGRRGPRRPGRARRSDRRARRLRGRCRRRAAARGTRRERCPPSAAPPGSWRWRWPSPTSGCGPPAPGRSRRAARGARRRCRAARRAPHPARAGAGAAPTRCPRGNGRRPRRRSGAAYGADRLVPRRRAPRPVAWMAVRVLAAASSPAARSSTIDGVLDV